MGQGQSALNRFTAWALIGVIALPAGTTSAFAQVFDLGTNQPKASQKVDPTLDRPARPPAKPSPEEMVRRISWMRGSVLTAEKRAEILALILPEVDKDPVLKKVSWRLSDAIKAYKADDVEAGDEELVLFLSELSEEVDALVQQTTVPESESKLRTTYVESTQPELTGVMYGAGIFAMRAGLRATRAKWGPGGMPPQVADLFNKVDRSLGDLTQEFKANRLPEEAAKAAKRAEFFRSQYFSLGLAYTRVARACASGSATVVGASKTAILAFAQGAAGFTAKTILRGKEVEAEACELALIPGIPSKGEISELTDAVTLVAANDSLGGAREGFFDRLRARVGLGSRPVDPKDPGHIRQALDRVGQMRAESMQKVDGLQNAFFESAPKRSRLKLITEFLSSISMGVYGFDTYKMVRDDEVSFGRVVTNTLGMVASSLGMGLTPSTQLMSTSTFWRNVMWFQYQSGVLLGVGNTGYGIWQIKNADRIAREHGMRPEEIRRQGWINTILGVISGFSAYSSYRIRLAEDPRFAQLMARGTITSSLRETAARGKNLWIGTHFGRIGDRYRNLNFAPYTRNITLLGKTYELPTAAARIVQASRSLGTLVRTVPKTIGDLTFSFVNLLDYGAVALIAFTHWDVFYTRQATPLPDLKSDEMAIVATSFDQGDLLYYMVTSKYALREKIAKYDINQNFFVLDFDSPDDLFQQMFVLSQMTRKKVRYLEIAAHGVFGKIMSRSADMHGTETTGAIDVDYLSSRESWLKARANESFAKDAQIRLFSCLVGGNLDEPVKTPVGKFPIDDVKTGDHFIQKLGDTLLVHGGVIDSSRRVIAGLEMMYAGVWDEYLMSSFKKRPELYSNVKAIGEMDTSALRERAGFKDVDGTSPFVPKFNPTTVEEKERAELDGIEAIKKTDPTEYKRLKQEFYQRVSERQSKESQKLQESNPDFAGYGALGQVAERMYLMYANLFKAEGGGVIDVYGDKLEGPWVRDMHRKDKFSPQAGLPTPAPLGSHLGLKIPKIKP